MQTIFVVIIATMITATLGIVAADVVRLKFVLANMAEVGVPVTWLPALEALKAAGALGLLLGLLGLPIIDVAAAIGLVIFFLGAVVTHVRARVFHNIAFPGTYLLLAIVTCVVVIIR